QRGPLRVPLPHRRSRVELPVRSRDQRRGRVRQLPPEEAELRGPHGADPNGPRRRVPARQKRRHVNELRLGAVLTRRFTRVAWTGLAGYALLVVALFAAAAEMALRRSLEHSADLTQSLLGAYRDSTSEPGGVMPSALADRLVAMGGQVVITRTTTGAGGKQDVYYVSPDMPARRLEGLPASASPELGRRLTSPTGQAEVTELADSVNRMLERVDRAHRALEAFTADASHELRTPLTHLRAQVQWAAAEGRTEGETREALGAMERVLDQTAKLVEELLLIARGENRQLALAHAPFELTAVVDEVREITEAMALGRDLAVSATPSPPRWALGDADRTRHILLNLASNAVRYTPNGRITFELATNGIMVGVSVRDTGPGIAPEHLGRIFDRFFRVDQ